MTSVSAPVARFERRALRGSIAASLTLGALGVAWGVASGSQMILLDGVFGLIGIATSWLLLRASAMAEAGPTRSYPFGREAATPLVIGIQGFVLLATLVYAAAEAAFTIADGGSEFAAGRAVVYSVIVTVSCVGVWWWLRRSQGGSELLEAEATAWGIAAFRGVGMMAGFSIMWALTGSRWDDSAAYVDPVMVLVTCVMTVGAPIQMVRTTVIELLEGAPAAAIREPVLEAVRAVAASFALAEPEVRMTKVGPKLYVEVEGAAAASVTIGQEHAVREELQRRLDELPYDVWLNFELIPESQ